MNNNLLNLIPRIKELYEKGENIIQYFKNQNNRDFNTLQDILISYDFQSGSYIKYAEQNPDFNYNYTTEISNIINNLGVFDSIVEVGVGEATTLGNVLPKLANDNIKAYGFDISWSRINFAVQYLEKIGSNANLFIADLFNIPFNTNSIDIVYTSHSIEPNGGREKEALQELHRVAGKYLILLEPTFEFANLNGQERMKKNGYVQNLKQTILDLKYDLILYEPFKYSSNPLNPTGLYVIKKHDSLSPIEKNNAFVCPISKTNLEEYNDHYFSSESLISYPKIMGIPCLCDFYGILTSKHNDQI